MASVVEISSSEDSGSDVSFSAADRNFIDSLRSSARAGTSLPEPLDIEPLQTIPWEIVMGRASRPESSRAREAAAAQNRREEQLASNSAASGSADGGDATGEDTESAWVLPDGIPVDEAGGRMTVANVNRIKRMFRLPGAVKLRPPTVDEKASILRPGFAAVHEAIFRQGVTLPLVPSLQILVCEFGLAFGQVCPNMWRLMLAMTSLWRLSGCEGPTVAEVLHFYELTYVKRQGCGGQVNLSRRQGAPKLIENLRDSMSYWRDTFCVATTGWEYQAESNDGEPAFRIKSEFQPIRGVGLRYNLTREEECRVARIQGCWQNRNLLDFRLLTGWELLVDQRLTRAVETPPGNARSRDAFAKAMDRAEIDNFLEAMYASGDAAQKTVIDPVTLAVSPSEVPVVLPMPLHSHLGADGLPVAQTGANVGGGKEGSSAAPQTERVPNVRRGPQKVVRQAGAAATVGQQQRGPRPAAAGQTRLLRKRRQNGSDEEDDDDAEVIGVRQRKKARQAPLKAPVAAAEEAPASDLDSFAAYAEFMTDNERGFLYHLCEILGFGGLAGISRPTAIDGSPFSSAFGHLSAGLHEMFMAAQKQPGVERQLRDEISGLERELGDAKDRLADVERRLTKADCDAADARGKLEVAIRRDVERNNHISRMEQYMSLLQERVAAKEKKIDILQRESAAKQAAVTKLEAEVARLRDEGTRVAAAAVEKFKQSAEYKKAMTESAKAGALANLEMLKQRGAIDFAKASQPPVLPVQNAPPVQAAVPVQPEGVRSGSGESGAQPADGSQQTPLPTQSEVSRAGFLAAHTRPDGTIETPSPTARGFDQTSRAQPQPPAEGGDLEANPKS
ncbi:uncharacterized protein LOC121049099 isoform X2 [Rosa chinensis]|uniref:uncharacterized protein LOC121049099 isoform X2 n=1 Tax=Rosa chinensis TaxID=74649 RepID=UPI001AD93B52|nr:uncharacterized protein LOC121049099 isoform X2 [Rosa chinensis]